ncbi:DNA-binding domain-containing protein [Hyalangium rubrum]|uniref:DNA-binding domain-containing protein n=1 Tax=Hyalangium rubrum TaxID=3103134 RepID=A0ABU5H8E7_9BACT|nr:putative DNA-binding domain-containing protein [Hyalangium sp. s54d21]MDY7229745.1 putative DNA-binding domain-containing protein [Hyalangium sp. s54d21]
MKPGLRHFFDTMDGYLAAPGGLERLRAAHPGWDAKDSRVALYEEFVRHHVSATVEKLYPLTLACLGPERWAELVRAYDATRPARHFEVNRLGEGFPAFVADVAAARGLPEFVPALVRFEWADWAVYASEEQVPERVERLTVNPTLTVLQHPFRLAPYIHAKATGPAPAPGDEMLLLWRHPQHHRTWFLAAHEQALLVLKMALEGLSAQDVAAATGVAEDHVRRAVEECTRDGLVLAP